MVLKKRRLGEFNIIKAMAILALPVVHFAEEASDLGFLNEKMDSATSPIAFLTIFGPAIFMFCMGVGIAGPQTPKRARKNGIEFLLIGYGLNFVAFSFPTILALLLGRPDTSVEEVFIYLFGADIYIFVGWFFVFYSFLLKKKLSDFGNIMTCIGMTVVNSVVSAFIHLPKGVASTAIGNFLSVNSESYFPLFGWMIFPMSGVALGNVLKKKGIDEYNSIMKHLFAASIMSMVVITTFVGMMGVSIIDMARSFTDNFTIDIPITIFLLSLTGIAIGLVYFIYIRVKENPVENFLNKIAMYIMAYYLVQWLLVSLVVDYFFRVILNLSAGLINVPVAIIVMVALVAASIVITYIYGYSFTKVILKITNYRQWFKTEKRKEMLKDYRN